MADARHEEGSVRQTEELPTTWIECQRKNRGAAANNLRACNKIIEQGSKPGMAVNHFPPNMDKVVSDDDAAEGHASGRVSDQVTSARKC